MAERVVDVETGTDFDTFFRGAEPLLRRALIAAFGGDLGRDAAAEALSYGWHHWERVRDLEHPVGYLYRVGERWARRHRSRPRLGFRQLPPAWDTPFEPALASALAGLSPRQRQVVVLVVGYGLSHSEAAELLSISRSSIQNHVERAMHALRTRLGADS